MHILDRMIPRASVPGLPASLREWLIHIRAQEADFWRTAKTRTVQFMAGFASILWATSLLFEKNTGFQNPGFTMMRDQMSATGWAAVFYLHAVCVMVCRWTPVPLLRFQWATSLFGFSIWSYYVLATWWSSGRPVIGTSFEIVGIFMLGWSLRRAGRDLKQGDGNVAL